jgi:hypothetical protein
MKSLAKLVCLSLILTTITAAALDKSFILEKFMDSPKELFKAYYTLFNKDAEYDINSEIGVSKYKVFKENVEWIKAENSKAGRQIYGITQFIDLTNAEFRDRYLMNPTKLEALLNINLDIKKNDEDNKVKDNDDDDKDLNIDWREKLNQAKHQQTCGSCWSFAAMAAVEGNYNINFGEILDLSEQYLVDCDDMDWGCKGGWPTRTFEWLKSNGVVLARENPYRNAQTICRSSERQRSLNIVQDFEFCEGNCEAKKWYELLKKGPIVVAMDASSHNFSKYKPSTIDEPWVPISCGKVDHAVNAVGVKKVGNNTLLIVRNSWGTGWGFEGYFSVSAENHCGIMNNGWLPITRKHVPYPAPVCPEFESDCDTAKNNATLECNGISSARERLGTTIKGWEQRDAGRERFNFYREENCKGSPDWKFKSEVCFARTRFARTTEYNSAASTRENPKIGCVFIYSGSCLTGTRYTVCNDVADLSSVGITSIGSILFNTISHPGNAVSLMIFDQTGFNGLGAAISRGRYFNLEDRAYFTNFATRARSLVISKQPEN